MKKVLSLTLILAFLVMPFVVSAAPSLVEYSSPTVTVTGNEIMVKAHLKNVGTEMTESWLLELQPRPSSLLSWIGGQETCDSSHPENVHKDFQLSSGGIAHITLTSTVSDGLYDVFLVMTDSCCNTNPDCQAKEPYGWGEFLGTYAVGGACTDTDGGEDYYVKGTTTATDGTATDYCSGHSVIEYYCGSDDTLRAVSYYCTYGCSDGACMHRPINWEGAVKANDRFYCEIPYEYIESLYGSDVQKIVGGTLSLDFNSPPNGVCGDGVCNYGETSENCPEDCPIGTITLDFTGLTLSIIGLSILALTIFI